MSRVYYACSYCAHGEKYAQYCKKCIDGSNYLSRNRHYELAIDGLRDGLRSVRIMPEIKNVIFNDPATIVFWSDDTKTVVKCQDEDIFDPEKGIAMAILKRSENNKGRYYNEIKKWSQAYYDEKQDPVDLYSTTVETGDRMNRLTEETVECLDARDVF